MLAVASRPTVSAATVDKKDRQLAFGNVLAARFLAGEIRPDQYGSPGNTGIERTKDLPWDSAKKLVVFRTLQALGAVGEEHAVTSRQVVEHSGGACSPRDVRHYCYHGRVSGHTFVGKHNTGPPGHKFALTPAGAMALAEFDKGKDIDTTRKSRTPRAERVRGQSALVPDDGQEVQVEESSQSHSGAGFGSAAENKLVEDAAVRAVTEHYEAEGWDVRSVERDKCGFDLKCSKSQAVEHVEVKGVRGTERCFLITAGEVKKSRTNRSFVLWVVTAALSADRILTRYTGPEFHKSFELSSVQFRAILRRPSRGTPCASI